MPRNVRRRLLVSIAEVGKVINIAMYFGKEPKTLHDW